MDVENSQLRERVAVLETHQAEIRKELDTDPGTPILTAVRNRRAIINGAKALLGEKDVCHAISGLQEKLKRRVTTEEGIRQQLGIDQRASIYEAISSLRRSENEVKHLRHDVKKICAALKLPFGITPWEHIDEIQKVLSPNPDIPIMTAAKEWMKQLHDQKNRDFGAAYGGPLVSKDFEQIVKALKVPPGLTPWKYAERIVGELEAWPGDHPADKIMMKKEGLHKALKGINGSSFEDRIGRVMYFRSEVMRITDSKTEGEVFTRLQIRGRYVIRPDLRDLAQKCQVSMNDALKILNEVEHIYNEKFAPFHEALKPFAGVTIEDRLARAMSIMQGIATRVNCQDLNHLNHVVRERIRERVVMEDPTTLWNLASDYAYKLPLRENATNFMEYVFDYVPEKKVLHDKIRKLESMLNKGRPPIPLKIEDMKKRYEELRQELP